MISKAYIELAGRVMLASGMCAMIWNVMIEPKSICIVCLKKMEEAMFAATKT